MTATGSKRSASGTGRPTPDGTRPPARSDAGEPRVEIRWPAGPPSPHLPPDELHVWAVELDRDAASQLELRTRLSQGERRRARRFGRTIDSRRSVACRALLRELLGGYLDLPPGEVAFRYGPAGKPALAGPRAESGIRFNVSHSGPLAVYAFARGVEVGVDVERVRPLPDLESVAARFFSDRETEALLDLDPGLRQEAFYRGWTRKEAYVKAIGDGLGHGLSDFDVTLAPDEAARLIRVKEDGAASRRWRLDHLAPAPGFVGALAVPAQGPADLRRWS